ncbi:acetoacetate--CoA ligase [Sphingobacterium griseoflavum]|uniref:Acetoacetyl-CoA synthetase n=1 Tax=Sphingobacterium griseoflavum TaxID=1474952 RepID=A0ABQ3HS29_9SPHI|nr:acetoacetate--CoA ligase [Sphingobacterium griseoflavum]GHE29450.1 acetoacetyl-CoA synthetase [Sphingobacterium griseoflavum]
MQNPLWSPSKSYQEHSILVDYQKFIRKHFAKDTQSYAAMYDWSVNCLGDFWESLLQYFDIRYSGSYDEVLQWDKASADFTRVTWFDGISLSYAEHIFKNKPLDGIALYYTDEKYGYQEISWLELQHKVSVLQQYLSKHGIQQGDRVAAVLTNSVEAVAIFLAVNSIGAIWSCCSPDFGDRSIAERFSLIEPKLLFMEMEYRYQGKDYTKEDTLHAILQAVPSLEAHMLVNSTDWQQLFEHYQPTDLIFTMVPFDFPIWILYSSGTTGKPKAITHRTGGNLLEHLKALAIHQNVQTGEKFLWYTTTGWMMWNYAMSSLLCGASLCLFNGAITVNNHLDFWNFVKRVGVDHLGAGASYFSAIHDLYIVDYQPKVIGSTGSPLPISTFENLQAKFPDAQIISLSGGTDVCSAFLSGCPVLPVYAGKIQCRTLGSAIVALNEEGQEVYNEVGELTITKPMPSMPIFFWNDPGHSRYRESYFALRPGKWSHGDWIAIEDTTGAVTMYGRSDATLNRGGVRIGTAEIYNAVQTVMHVLDSLVISTDEVGGGSRMLLFLQLEEGYMVADVERVVKEAIRTQYSARHVPDLFFQVPEIPYTLSGKKLEIPVKKIFSGKPLADVVSSDIMKNPDSMHAFASLYSNWIAAAR